MAASTCFWGTRDVMQQWSLIWGNKEDMTPEVNKYLNSVCENINRQLLTNINPLIVICSYTLLWIYNNSLYMSPSWVTAALQTVWTLVKTHQPFLICCSATKTELFMLFGFVCCYIHLKMINSGYLQSSCCILNPAVWYLYFIFVISFRVY